jgi:hypothetical protein
MLIIDSLPMNNGGHLEVCLQVVRNSADFVYDTSINHNWFSSKFCRTCMIFVVVVDGYWHLETWSWLIAPTCMWFSSSLQCTCQGLKHKSFFDFLTALIRFAGVFIFFHDYTLSYARYGRRITKYDTRYPQVHDDSVVTTVSWAAGSRACHRHHTEMAW